MFLKIACKAQAYETWGLGASISEFFEDGLKAATSNPLIIGCFIGCFFGRHAAMEPDSLDRNM